MDDQSLTPPAQATPAASSRRRALWPLAAVAIVAVAGAGAGAYFGLRGAKGPGAGPAGGPPARAYAAAAYDEASHQVVLFGGIGAAGMALDDTWTWDGSAWTQQHPHSSPPARAYAAMTYDPKNRDVVLVGGSSAGASPPTVCSGSVTATGPNATPVPSRAPTPCAFKAATPFYDTWLWDGSTWRAAGPAPGVLGQGPAVGTDPTTGQVLLLVQTPSPATARMCPAPSPIAGGSSGTSGAQPAIACATPVIPTLREWLWSGDRWNPLPAEPPMSGLGIPLGSLGTLVADPTSGHLADITVGMHVVCGGADTPLGSVPLGSVPPCPLYAGAGGVPPYASSSPAIAPAACCTVTVTTWTGNGWSKAATFDNGPEPPGSPTLAGDPPQHDVVGFTPLGTWTWNGAAWKQEHPPTSPPQAVGGTLVYDGSSQRLLLFGGELIATNPSLPTAAPVSDELWAWDGTTWSQLGGAKASPPRSLPPTPTPTFVSPEPPIPVSPPPAGGPLPSLPSTRCSPIATAPPPVGTSTGGGEGCVTPVTSTPKSGPTAP